MKNIFKKNKTFSRSNRNERNQIIHDDISFDKKRILSEDTPFAIKEAYRALYTNLLYLPSENKCKKIAVTSASAGEGKSTVSLNIAYSLAQNSIESKILFIEADMRSPRASKLIGIHQKNKSGLSEYLAGIDNEPNIITHPEYTNLFMLFSGTVTSNTPALFRSSKMKTLLDNIKDEFDYVVIDTPPVNMVSDAILISDYIDGYLVVVRSDYSDVTGVTSAVDSIKQVDGKVMGFILTAYDAKKSKKYYYSKYSYYDYGDGSHKSDNLDEGKK